MAHAEKPSGASAITVAEILVRPVRLGILEDARAALQALEIQEIPVPQGAPERLARLRAETGLKLPDCCVLLAAQDVAATAVLTLDDQLAKRAAELGFGPGLPDTQ